MQTPVTIIAGFLGAGKTTLLNNLLSTVPEGRKIAVIVNEFGKTGVDGRLIAHHGFMVKEVSGGCVCCTLRPELLRVLQMLAAEKAYDEIIIESTGLALPAEMARDVESLKKTHGVTSAGIFGVVDGPLYYRLPTARAMMVNRQLLESDCILLNKTDLLDTGMIASVRDALENTVGNSVPIVETAFANIDMLTFNRLLKVKRTQNEPLYEQSVNSTSGYKNVELTLATPLDIVHLRLFFEKFASIILRAKGILELDTGNRVVQYSTSGFSCEAYDGSADNRLVVILDTRVSGCNELTSELLRLNDSTCTLH